MSCRIIRRPLARSMRGGEGERLARDDRPGGRWRGNPLWATPESRRHAWVEERNLYALSTRRNGTGGRLVDRRGKRRPPEREMRFGSGPWLIQRRGRKQLFTEAWKVLNAKGTRPLFREKSDAEQGMTVLPCRSSQGRAMIDDRAGPPDNRKGVEKDRRAERAGRRLIDEINRVNRYNTKDLPKGRPFVFAGAPSGARTRDTLIKSQVLYQLS